MPEPKLQEARPERPLWRVARRDAPFRASVGSPEELLLPKAGYRFDSQRGDYGVIYFGSTLTCCFGEVLAPLRPSAAMIAAVQGALDGMDYLLTSKIEADWRQRRSAVLASVTDPRPFIDVEHPETHAILTKELAVSFATLGVGRLDVASLRGSDRRVTRTISQWIHDQVNVRGERLYAGVRYLSKICTDWECWAVFNDTNLAPLDAKPITVDMPELQEIRDLYSLVIY